MGSCSSTTPNLPPTSRRFFAPAKSAVKPKIQNNNDFDPTKSSRGVVVMGSSSTVTDLRADVFIGPFLNFEQGGGTFAATTSTLVSGKSDAVLIDAQHIRTDVAALAEFIGRTGKKLTTIYITHGH